MNGPASFLAVAVVAVLFYFVELVIERRRR
jgi:hypothetical protein